MDKQALSLFQFLMLHYPVRLLVALKPTQTAQGVDSIIFEEHKKRFLKVWRIGLSNDDA